MDRVRFSHDEHLAPGTWMLSDGQPVLRCPDCKKAAAMVNHSVDVDGTVNASIACFPPCQHHVWGILDGWTHGAKPAQERVP